MSTVWNDLFDLKNGQLFWKVKPSKRVRIGDKVGSLNSCGYLGVQIKRKHYQVHRIIFEMTYGPIPNGMEIDHINHNRQDNSPTNLRLVTHRQNQRNQSKSTKNTSGIVGVSWKSDRKKWHAQIRVNGKTKHLGFFENIADAAIARKNANASHKYHENHGGDIS